MIKSPKLLMIVGAFCFVLILGIFVLSSGKNVHRQVRENTTTHKAFDVASGDTNNELLRTIVANQQKLESENATLRDKNRALSHTKDDALKKELGEDRNELLQKIKNTKDLVEAEMKKHSNLVTNSSYPVGNNNQQKSVITTITDDSNFDTDNPARTEGQVVSGNTPELPSDHKSIDSENKGIVPYYTIPSGSTLAHVSLMSSIIAEVPVNGHLLSPAFPFKAIVGRRQLLAANGMTLPDNLAGMVVSGYSVGNMTMGCARIYVTHSLFVFHDGHFVVYPKKESSDPTQMYPKDALGYLTDSYGNTCIKGKYITDAAKVIGTMASLGGIATGAQALSQAQTSTATNAFQSNTNISGNMTKFIGGAVLSGAAEKALDWYNSRVSGVFDAVFIPSSLHHRPTNLTLNITKTIPIDLNKHGRTLKYEHDEMSGQAHSLD